jgi:hypothetical protein
MVAVYEISISLEKKKVYVILCLFILRVLNDSASTAEGIYHPLTRGNDHK